MLQHSSMSTVKLLLESQKVQVNAADNSGRTPLSYAVKHPRLRNLVSWVHMWFQDGEERQLEPRKSLLGNSTLKALIDTGKVDLDSRDDKDRTPLSYAAELADPETFELLLRSGAMEVDLPDGNGETPIYHAIKRCNVLVVELLLNTYEYDPDHLDNNDYATIFELLDFWGYLESSRDSKGVDCGILDAVRSGCSRLVMMLQGCSQFDPNRVNGQGQTPLSHCVLLGYSSRIRKALTFSPRVNLQRHDPDICRTSLWYAHVEDVHWHGSESISSR